MLIVGIGFKLSMPPLCDENQFQKQHHYYTTLLMSVISTIDRPSAEAMVQGAQLGAPVCTVCQDFDSPFLKPQTFTTFVLMIYCLADNLTFRYVPMPPPSYTTANHQCVFFKQQQKHIQRPPASFFSSSLLTKKQATFNPSQTQI